MRSVRSWKQRLVRERGVLVEPTRTGFSRRMFLGGASVALALPFLESALPRMARAADAPKRFIAVYVPCGIHMAAWTPPDQGPGFTLTPILASLAPVQSKVNVLTGLANVPANPDGPGDHASGTGAFLTAAHPFKTEGANIQNGISVDQVAANAIGQETKVPSLQLGIDGGSSGGDCDSGYSCAYARNISWASDTQPLSKTTNPKVVFDSIFAGFDPAATQAEQAKQLKYRTSVLDHVLGEAKSLEPKLGTTDSRKLDEYMTGIYALEEKLGKLGSGPACPVTTAPPENLGYPEHVQAMNDLMVLAVQCDVTRIATFMMANAGSGHSFPFVGVNGGHHEISHHQDNPQNFADLQKIDTWEVEQLAYLLAKLDAIDEGAGVTLLDNSLVFFSSEIEDGNSHSHKNMPIVLAGRAGGIQSGRHVVYSGDPPVANLFISILDALGVPATTFGDDGTGSLGQLT